MIERVAVIVPAADEQERIAACLRSIRRSVRRAVRMDRAVTVDLIVVLDDCRDATDEIVARFAEVTAVSVTARRVGPARQAGAAVAIERAAAAGIAPDRLWLANTDADSAVPADWLVHALAAAEAGFELVLGTVRPDHELSDLTRAIWHGRHRLADGHPHVHGANLGLRGDVLQALGGWPNLAVGEDVELVRRAEQVRRRIHRSGAVPVVTSSRPVGRAPAGFSSYLRALATDGVDACFVPPRRGYRHGGQRGGPSGSNDPSVLGPRTP